MEASRTSKLASLFSSCPSLIYSLRIHQQPNLTGLSLNFLPLNMCYCAHSYVFLMLRALISEETACFFFEGNIQTVRLKTTEFSDIMSQTFNCTLQKRWKVSMVNKMATMLCDCTTYCFQALNMTHPGKSQWDKCDHSQLCASSKCDDYTQRCGTIVSGIAGSK